MKKYIIITDSDGNHFLRGWMTLDIFLSAVFAVNGKKSCPFQLEELFYENGPRGVADWIGNAKIEIRK